MRRLALLAALVAAPVAAAAQPVPQAQWPAEVRAAHQENVAACREQNGGLAIGSADYVRSADFNGDGQPDYVIDQGRSSAVPPQPISAAGSVAA